MDFGLSDDQELLRQSARDFLARECPPSMVRQIAEGPTGVSESLDRKIAEMGWTGVLIPESHGGLGLGMLEMAVLLGEFGRASVPGAFFFSAVLATMAIVRAADRRQKQEWLPKLASGQSTATLALLEESDRLDPTGIPARATRSGSGYRLSVKKLFVPYAHAVDWLVPACRTAGAHPPAPRPPLSLDPHAPRRPPP